MGGSGNALRHLSEDCRTDKYFLTITGTFFRAELYVNRSLTLSLLSFSACYYAVLCGMPGALFISVIMSLCLLLTVIEVCTFFSRVLSTGGGGSFPPKVFLKKNLKQFQILIVVYSEHFWPDFTGGLIHFTSSLIHLTVQLLF